MPEANYSLWAPAEGPAGGFNPLGEDVKVDNVLIYVDSDDIEADFKEGQVAGRGHSQGKIGSPGLWVVWGVQRSHGKRDCSLYRSAPFLMERMNNCSCSPRLSRMICKAITLPLGRHERCWQNAQKWM